MKRHPKRHLPKTRNGHCTCQSLHWPQAHDFLRGGNIYANLHAHAVITTLRTLAQHCKRLSPLLAAPAALLLSQAPAKAILTYNIFESGSNVVIQTSGSLNLPQAPISPFPSDCQFGGAIYSAFATICTGPSQAVFRYGITGSTSFNGTVINTSGSLQVQLGNLWAIGI